MAAEGGHTRQRHRSARGPIRTLKSLWRRAYRALQRGNHLTSSTCKVIPAPLPQNAQAGQEACRSSLMFSARGLAVVSLASSETDVFVRNCSSFQARQGLALPIAALYGTEKAEIGIHFVKNASRFPRRPFSCDKGGSRLKELHFGSQT